MQKSNLKEVVPDYTNHYFVSKIEKQYADNKIMFADVDWFSGSAEKIDIPDDILWMSEGWGVKTSNYPNSLTDYLKVKDAYPIWIGCRQAGVHNDSGWKNKYFVSFVLMGDTHRFDCIQDGKRFDFKAKKGTLFIFDPVIFHALTDINAMEENEMPAPWACLQWEIPKENYQEYIVEICNKLTDIEDKNG
jgi:hypothetical protein